MLAYEPGLELVAAATNADEALDLERRKRPDVVLLDYQLPHGDGLTLSLQMQSRQSAPRAVIYSAFADETLTVLAIVAGARAVVGKAAAPEELCETIRSVARGERTLSPPPPPAMEAIASRLDPDDMPVLGMLIHGTEPVEIAETLAVDESWLTARRWAMLERLRRRPSRGSRPPHEPILEASGSL